MFKIYKFAHKSYEILSSSNAKVLLLDYDKLEEWPNTLKRVTKIVDNNLSTYQKVTEELNTDYQSKFFDNDKKEFDNCEVNKFMSMNLPIYNW